MTRRRLTTAAECLFLLAATYAVSVLFWEGWLLG